MNLLLDMANSTCYFLIFHFVNEVELTNYIYLLCVICNIFIKSNSIKIRLRRSFFSTKMFVPL